MLFGTISREPSLDETTNSKKDDLSFIERLKLVKDNNIEDQTRNDKILLNSNLSSIPNECTIDENIQNTQKTEEITKIRGSIITDFD